jgi:hypothetical protein
LALDVLVHHARHWIGSFLLQLNGADALVFTAGMGENQTGIRQAVCDHLDQLGIVLDPEQNQATRAREGVISTPNSRVKVLVIPTNEELVVSREVKRFLEKSPSAAGVRPSSGAATPLHPPALDSSAARLCSGLAAPEDGRAPKTNLLNIKR